jgi:hypothetical protein
MGACGLRLASGCVGACVRPSARQWVGAWGHACGLRLASGWVRACGLRLASGWVRACGLRLASGCVGGCTQLAKEAAIQLRHSVATDAAVKPSVARRMPAAKKTTEPCQSNRQPCRSEPVAACRGSFSVKPAPSRSNRQDFPSSPTEPRLNWQGGNYCAFKPGSAQFRPTCLGFFNVLGPS